MALKELGFDEPCFTFYWDNAVMYNSIYNPHNYNRNNEISTPLYQQAFRWFRENYGVHMYTTKYDETKWWIEWGTWTSEVFNSFEEAELACLKKLIDIVKEK